MSASEASTLQANTPTIVTEEASTGQSKFPVLGEGFQETSRSPVSKSAGESTLDGRTDVNEGSKSGKKRSIFGFGKKKVNDSSKERDGDEASTQNMASTPIAQPVAQRPRVPSSPQQNNHPYNMPSSPQRNLYSSSPRIASPAGSQIFERDVQESSLPVPNSPAIPSHIQTENHIPPVLDASSEAITNSNLNPDSVEIVMHTAHQPAAVTVTGVNNNDAVWSEDQIPHPEREDATSGYGGLDTTDVRRLSFISFSDIVQSEHAEHSGTRDSIYIGGLSSLSSGHNRSPSPIRSPVSSQGLGASPPTSKSASIKGVEVSSAQARPLGSPSLSTHGQPGNSGELTIETMSQALRRTGSGDLSGFRSQPLSPSSPDGLSDRSFR